MRWSQQAIDIWVCGMLAMIVVAILLAIFVHPAWLALAIPSLILFFA